MKKPKYRFSSPLIIAQRPIVSVTTFSADVLRGIMRGLLSHICRQQKGLSIRWLHRAENKFMSYAMATMKNLGVEELMEQQAARLVEVMCADVQRMLCEKKQHTYRTLNADSDRILLALTRDGQASQQVYDKLAFGRPYDEIDRREQRVAWLKEEIPEILKVLQAQTVCFSPGCISRAKCMPPPPETIEKWAKNPYAGRLRDNILGHFHAISPQRVKRLLTNCPKPPSQS